MTGSVGKTTTKEFIYGVLTQKYKVLKTEGNLNNEIGLPLTIFKMDSSYQAAVIEMGMSNVGGNGEAHNDCTAQMCSDHQYRGRAHRDASVRARGILKAKLEILNGLQDGGFAVFNGDEPLLWDLKGKLDIPILYFGIDNNECDYLARDIEERDGAASFSVSGKAEFKAYIPIIGRHNVMRCPMRRCGRKNAGLKRRADRFGTQIVQPNKNEAEYF